MQAFRLPASALLRKPAWSVSSVRVLQNFHTYLKTTENWSFNLISGLPDVTLFVASKQFEKCNFYNPRFTYIEFPLRKIETLKPTYAVRLYNNMVRTMLRHLYPAYVKRMCAPVDLMHSHFSFVGWEYRNLARTLKVPHIVSFYGFDYEWLPHNEPVWAQRYKQLFNDADLFLCEGEHGATILRNAGCPHTKIKVARLGVNCAQIPYVERQKKAGELKLLQIASLTPKKGHRYSILAFLSALEKYPEMSLTIVGGDSEGLKAGLVQLIPPDLLATKIHFIDRIDFSKLYEFMSDFQLFIHPSCYSDDRDCEGGAPVVLLDAQATGMPVVASTHCDIPSVVCNGTTGLLAPEKDSEALSSLIATFYDMDQVEYTRFARAARQHVEQDYDVNANAVALRTIYQQLVDEYTGNT